MGSACSSPPVLEGDTSTRSEGQVLGPPGVDEPDAKFVVRVPLRLRAACAEQPQEQIVVTECAFPQPLIHGCCQTARGDDHDAMNDKRLCVAGSLPSVSIRCDGADDVGDATEAMDGGNRFSTSAAPFSSSAAPSGENVVETSVGLVDPLSMAAGEIVGHTSCPVFAEDRVASPSAASPRLRTSFRRAPLRMAKLDGSSFKSVALADVREHTTTTESPKKPQHMQTPTKTTVRDDQFLAPTWRSSPASPKRLAPTGQATPFVQISCDTVDFGAVLVSAHTVSTATSEDASCWPACGQQQQTECSDGNLRPTCEEGEQRPF